MRQTILPEWQRLLGHAKDRSPVWLKANGLHLASAPSRLCARRTRLANVLECRPENVAPGPETRFTTRRGAPNLPWHRARQPELLNQIYIGVTMYAARDIVLIMPSEVKLERFAAHERGVGKPEPGIPTSLPHANVPVLRRRNRSHTGGG